MWNVFNLFNLISCRCSVASLLWSDRGQDYRVGPTDLSQTRWLLGAPLHASESVLRSFNGVVNICFTQLMNHFIQPWKLKCCILSLVKIQCRAVLSHDAQLLLSRCVLQSCPLLIVTAFTNNASMVMGVFIGIGVLLVGNVHISVFRCEWNSCFSLLW